MGLGTRDAYMAIRTDSRLENRLEPFVLPPWRSGPEAARLLASFAAVLPLRRPSDLQRPEVVRAVLARTGGTIGEIAALMRAAAVAAIASREEAVTARALELAAYRGSGESRQAMERELA